MICAPTALDPVKVILRTAGCSASGRPASSPNPEIRLATPGGNTSCRISKHPHHRERRLLGGLEHDGVARRQRRPSLRRRLHQRRIPRNDRADDAHGNALRVKGKRCGVQRHRLALARSPARRRSAGCRPSFAPRRASASRCALPVSSDDRPAIASASASKPVRGFEQQKAALPPRQCRPRRKRRRRGGHRATTSAAPQRGASPIFSPVAGFSPESFRARVRRSIFRQRRRGRRAAAPAPWRPARVARYQPTAMSRPSSRFPQPARFVGRSRILGGSAALNSYACLDSVGARPKSIAQRAGRKRGGTRMPATRIGRYSAIRRGSGRN